MTVYLLHFTHRLGNPATPHGEAQHYIGTSHDPETRLHDHLTGTAAAITRAAVHHGAQLLIVRTWEGDRQVERRLKRRKEAPRLCPLCREAARQRRSGHRHPPSN